MNVFAHITEALANLFSAKLRSLLAVLGILIGTASVVVMVSSGEFATQRALQEFKQLGTDLLALSLYSSDTSANAANALDLATIMALPDHIKEIQQVAPYISLYLPIVYDGDTLAESSSVVATTATLQSVIKIKLQQGRFISFLDKYSYFCVIGHKLYQKLSAQGIYQPVGTQIKLGNHYFTIIGVAAPWPENAFFNNDINEAVIVPLPTVNILSKDAAINSIIFQTQMVAGSTPEVLQQKITDFFLERQPTLKLFFRSSEELIKSMQKQQQIFTLLLGLIGSISLIVGGIGVMNIMLVSILERRREIGIRLAVGATRRDIRVLFLIEAVGLTVGGGLIGIVLGILVSYIVAYFFAWDFSLLLLPPAIGFTVSALTGIFFGFYPAYKASQLDPIQTLRAE